MHTCSALYKAIIKIINRACQRVYLNALFWFSGQNVLLRHEMQPLSTLHLFSMYLMLLLWWIHTPWWFTCKLKYICYTAICGIYLGMYVRGSVMGVVNRWSSLIGCLVCHTLWGRAVERPSSLREYLDNVPPSHVIRKRSQLNMSG